MTPYNPDNAIDLLGLLIVGMSLVLAGAIPAWLSHRYQNRKLERIDKQVVNDHDRPNTPNLRDQVDSMDARIDILVAAVARLEGRFDEHLRK